MALEKKYYSGSQVFDIIRELPDKEFLSLLNTFAKEHGADVVEVVRCKDCKHYVNDRLKKDFSEDKRFKRRVCIASEYAKLRSPDWYCADGERREDGETKI